MADGPSARLFVALDLPDAARTALTRWRAPLVSAAARGGGGALRAVAPESLHVTLCFLGALPAGAVAPLADAVAAVVAELGAPAASAGADAPQTPADRRPPAPVAGRLALAGALWLPPRRPRVLAVALDDGDGSLGALQDALARRLEAGGWLRRERRPFLAHVTVARVRAGAAPPDVPAAPPALAFAGTAVTLYRSHLGGGPARYEPLARVPLR